MNRKNFSEFDGKAREWDNNPVHIERSEAIARSLLSVIPLNKKMHAFEFGAGTGLLSFLLKHHFASITLMDSSVEMINVVRTKIAHQQIPHMIPVHMDLEKENFPGLFDIIYSQMVFHHVANLDTVLEKFLRMLRPGGYIAIADLYPEDGSFHGEGFTGHLGFDVHWLADKLHTLGFTGVSHRQCYRIKRPGPGGISEFPVFLMTART
jgi:ubiquinone/menaquinone biosynthesis C-methylase UbiE